MALDFGEPKGIIGMIGLAEGRKNFVGEEGENNEKAMVCGGVCFGHVGLSCSGLVS